MSKYWADKINGVDDVVAEDFNDAFLKVSQDVDTKVTKEEGKGLSTEDYTTAEKEKLASLSNYDDTNVINALANKVDKSSITTILNAESTDEEIPTAKAVYDADDALFSFLEPRITATENSIVELDNRISSVEVSIGDIDTALDNIIAIQNKLIGGGTV